MLASVVRVLSEVTENATEIGLNNKTFVAYVTGSLTVGNEI